MRTAHRSQGRNQTERDGPQRFHGFLSLHKRGTIFYLA